jgi:hypothetical protein
MDLLASSPPVWSLAARRGPRTSPCAAAWDLVGWAQLAAIACHRDTDRHWLWIPVAPVKLMYLSLALDMCCGWLCIS